MDHFRRGLLISAALIFSVGMVTLFGSSGSGTPSILAQENTQMLWNPAEYHNVFADGEVNGPDWSKPEWTTKQIREALHKVMQSVDDLTTVRSSNWANLQSSIDSLTSQQNIDHSTLGAIQSGIDSATKDSHGSWTSFESNAKAARQQEIGDMQAIRQQLAQLLTGLQYDRAGSDISRKQQLADVKKSLIASKNILKNMVSSQTELDALTKSAVQKSADTLKVFNDAKTLRASISQDIDAAKASVEAAEKVATEALNADSSQLTTDRATYSGQVLQHGKRLDDIGNALQALGVAQAKLHDQIVANGVQESKDFSDALNQIAASASANLNTFSQEERNQLDALSTSLGSLQKSIDDNQIQQKAQDALNQLQQTLKAHQTTEGINLQHVDNDVADVDTKVTGTQDTNSALLTKVTALKDLVNALRLNITTEKQGLVDAVKAAFEQNVGALSTTNKDSLNALKSDLNGLTQSESKQVSSIQDLIKKVASQVESATSKQGSVSSTVAKYAANAKEHVSKKADSYSAKIAKAASSLNDDKTAINTKIAAASKSVDELNDRLANFTRPLGPKGKRGPEGAPGLPGEAGPTGKIGSPGVAGKVGPVGLPGLPGDIGKQGIVGKVGAVGKAGPKGPQGADGLIGDIGVPGKVGPPGPVGETGPAGVSGPPGPDGPPGAIGPIGRVGPAGKSTA